MRPSPVISAIGTGALAFGLVITMAPGVNAGTAPVPQAPVPDDEAATMLEAMERDLDLTPFEAEELLNAQEEAIELDEEATEAAGAAYGGSLFDTDTHELTVLVTDTDAVEAVEATGASAEVVSYGADGLADIVEDLNATDAGSDVVGWYPDVTSDSVVVEVVEGTGVDVDSLVEGTGVDPAVIEIQEVSEQPQTYANIIGGLAYYMSSGGRCSVGFPATNSSGQPGFVTAGHCGNVGTGVTIGNGRGTFERSVFPGNDAAFVRGTSNFTLYNLVYRYSGYQTVTGSNAAPIGSSVCRSGSTTGWHCGTIQARNQTVRYPQGTVYYLTRTTVCAEPGDSGGSFISGTQAQGVTSGGSGNCSSGGTTFYQEVDPMERAWGVRLRTS
ncbi:S1 family peptidase [Nocardiopsis sp. FIRDI 009]|uniref:S1 family peptidase n=1 Tax=Nocardiopsis sp. FIRDI 009 TaxID=714197 RepID=UPI000E23C061|nr:S1 family peptidase [Nocardiopsis sp. FIRDI 009]